MTSRERVERNTQIIACYEQGMDIKSISEKFGLSLSPTYKVINERYSINKRDKSVHISAKISTELHDKILDLSSWLNISKSRVIQYLIYTADYEKIYSLVQQNKDDI